MNPFEPAADAVVMDTGDRTVDETLSIVVALVHERLPELFR